MNSCYFIRYKSKDELLLLDKLITSIRVTFLFEIFAPIRVIFLKVFIFRSPLIFYPNIQYEY